MAGKINLQVYGPDRDGVFELGVPPMKYSEYEKFQKARRLVEKGEDKDGKAKSFIAKILGRTAEALGTKSKDPDEGTGEPEGGKE